MSEHAIQFLQRFNLSPELIVFCISLMPILELRGGLIAAAFLKIPIIKAFLICFTANILPIPFILLFIRKILELMKKVKAFKGIAEWLERKAINKSGKVRQRQMVGLFFFVAIPLPGTGGWTGSLVSAILELPIWKSFIVILFGILTAGFIMLTLTYFIPGLFGF